VPGPINEKKFICIICPIGCAVIVKADPGGNIIEVLGNKCKKGDKYAREEFTMPMRVLTSTVAIEGAAISRLPVRTSNVIPKDKLSDCMKEIQKFKARAPVKCGDKLIENILGLEVDVIATRNLST
jgi:CxxC motif-containing protein